jgi:hypothetical protein
MDDPKRTKLRMEIVDPICRQSNAESVDAMVCTPYTEYELPSLPYIRRLMALPSDRKSSTETHEPIVNLRITDAELP